MGFGGAGCRGPDGGVVCLGDRRLGAVRYNQADPSLPDLLVCEPRYAQAALSALL